MFTANIIFFFSRFSVQHSAVVRIHNTDWSGPVYSSDDLDLTEFFHSLLCGTISCDGNIHFRDFSSLDAFVASLENFCILEFFHAYALTDLQLLRIERFLLELTDAAVFLRDNYECFI